RVRPVSVKVAIGAVLDDGETLTPMSMQPVEMTASQFAGFELAVQVAWVQEQIGAKRAESAQAEA
ncbi:hypothetical protein, partial [Microbacterium paludicola]|uniref:hypothetical protein n=1 Tax=Microbacterium paludicola TaxID=300019 RepID=UPI0031DE3ABF